MTMHSIYQRVNGISALLSSCLLALLAAITLSSLAIQATRPSVDGKIDIASLKVSVFVGRVVLRPAYSSVRVS
jgi:signal peptidase complex subunit 3